MRGFKNSEKYELTSIIRESFRQSGLIIIFFAMLVIFTFLSPHFLTVDNFRNVLRQISVLFLVASGQTLIMLTGGIDLSQGSVFSLVSMITAIGLVSRGLLGGILYGLTGGIICGGITGILVGKLKLQPFIASLGMMYIAEGFALISNNGQPISNIPRDVADRFFLLGGGYIGSVPIPVIFMAVIFIIIYTFLRRTKTGRYIYAIGGNEEAARLSGIHVDNIKVLIFIIDGLLVAIGSMILTARIIAGHPLLGADMLMQSLGAAVIGGTSLTGGRGGVINCIFGVLFIGFMTNGLNLLGIPTFAQRVVIGTIIIISVFMATVGEETR